MRLTRSVFLPDLVRTSIQDVLGQQVPRWCENLSVRVNKSIFKRVLVIKQFNLHFYCTLQDPLFVFLRETRTNSLIMAWSSVIPVLSFTETSK